MSQMLKFTIFVVSLTYVCAQKSAIVYLFDPTGNSQVTGEVTFTKSSNGLVATGTVTGLAPGKHGFHIHELGNIGAGCTAAGAHFNPHNLTHGAPEDSIRHVGDLGNINVGALGTVVLNLSDTLISLEGEHSIIGRAVVVHEGEDDLGKGNFDDSLTTGHAGGRLACGVIGIL
ncbi:hypothetical protein NQ314_014421 [Rhamnusium bicolor]|uniref:Superoxide dismutase [Cu-Zn] n=1 Tax=Rhamnusium bicolor TaxID=1586634 RepID=A0AAV8X1F1_9CUCU|nr:hypothetical protein NQ314_014421 [Rhamnusium bicolor]